MKIFRYTYKSLIGPLLIESDENSLISLSLKESNFSDSSFVIDKTIEWLDRYFNGEKLDIKEFKFNFKCSDFQKEVLDELIKIPYGQSITYKEIAFKIANKRGIEKMSAQAIGQAVSKNPIMIIIPCHRVLGKDRKLVGYAYGLDVKTKLLELEHIEFKRAF